MEAYEELANAIVIMAAKDYRKALRTLKKGYNPSSEKYIRAAKMKSDCERFFMGEWFKSLTDLDGRKIMENIQKKS